MKKIDRQRKITLAALSMALVVAVYLNWQYTRTGADSYIMTEDASVLQQELMDTIESSQLTEMDLTETAVNPEGDLLAVSNEDEVKNYGDAQLVATTEKSTQKYFEETRLSRQKSRDEALDVLQKTLKNAKLSDTEKTNATAELSKIVKDITAESDIENLVKAKGFTDCVAFINGDKISVAVQVSNGDLTKQNVAQIRDIVLNKTQVPTQNIVIIEVK
ncbi:MAG: SpoIIIAH-like family protein [Oscillospiraceae bacterium]|nr:SpoIIIAH-like family protein [Oscillospiraceae bacterium]MBP1552734.1 SpoIIIAH-like family protein [Oscillospiraceae bacterium]